jgi:hypothetical protein
MMRQMRDWCRGPDGQLDVNRMSEFLEHHDRGSRLDAIGWGLFFIWVGTAWLVDVGLGIGLLGVGAITLGMQLCRKVLGLPVEGFWLFVGGGFAVAGLWAWFDIQRPLAPFILVAIGVALLFWRAWPRARGSDGHNATREG